MVEVQFRIDAGYKSGRGLSRIDLMRFNFEIDNLLESIGWQFKENDTGLIMIHGAESLYCHPTAIEGHVYEESISKIKELLLKAHTFVYKEMRMISA